MGHSLWVKKKEYQTNQKINEFQPPIQVKDKKFLPVFVFKAVNTKKKQIKKFVKLTEIVQLVEKQQINTRSKLVE